MQSAATWTLAAEVENLTLTGTTAINGTGNALANVLTGNSAANVLTGGAGNDTYVVGLGDTTVEASGGGTDTVQSAITWTLATEVENLTLTGTAAVDGTGNTLNNQLVGNSAANALNGAAGADTMYGGAGDDLYSVDNVGDVVTELAGEGVDQVNASVSYTLAADVENLVLVGSSATNATGNALANVLTGNTGANVLTGGAGDDTYQFGRGSGSDTVVDSDATAGNADLVQFLSSIQTDQVWFRHVGADLNVSIIGTTDALAVKDWYAGSQNWTEQFRTSDGHALLASAVQNLVDAMASFAPPAAGQTTLPANYATALAPLIASNWH